MTHDPGDHPDDSPDRPHSLRPRRPRTLGGAVYLGVLAVTGMSLAVVTTGRWRHGLVLMALGVLVGAAGRWVLPDERAGMLGVRRKFVDVLTLMLMGGALLTLALLVPGRF